MHYLNRLLLLLLEKQIKHPLRIVLLYLKKVKVFKTSLKDTILFYYVYITKKEVVFIDVQRYLTVYSVDFMLIIPLYFLKKINIERQFNLFEFKIFKNKTASLSIVIRQKDVRYS
jgi:hypothetical protein